MAHLLEPSREISTARHLQPPWSRESAPRPRTRASPVEFLIQEDLVPPILKVAGSELNHLSPKSGQQ